MEMKEYTLEELAGYNGKNGKIYIAYQGQVYDVTDSYLWDGGNHQGLHDAGQDLTEEMDDAPHGPETFKDYPVVGTLKE
jgi:predicted heme/steroid binding protein